jgi:hypothetical protein
MEDSVRLPGQPNRKPLERLLRTDRHDRATAVQPWATVKGADDGYDRYDLPPAVRAGREERAAQPARAPLLDRSSQDVFQQSVDDELSHLDMPTFVRKLAD